MLPIFTYLFFFYSIRIRPRFLRDVSKQTSKCNVLGINIDLPIGIAPTAMQRMAHPDGEIAAAKGAISRPHYNFYTLFEINSKLR